MPALGVHWSAKINRFTSSTTAEVIAVGGHSDLHSHTLQELSWSSATLDARYNDSITHQQRIQLRGRSELSLLLYPLAGSKSACSGSLPIRIAGNELADRLADAAHSLLPTIDPPRDPRAVEGLLKLNLRVAREEAYSKRQPLPLLGLTRQDVAVLFRICTGTARTCTWLHKVRLKDSPQCPNCAAVDSITHAFLQCPALTSTR